MFTLTRKEYEKLLDGLKLSIEMQEKSIDVYHRNNWDRFTMNYDEETKNENPSYIDFFFDAKSMTTFIKKFLNGESFKECYIASLYNDRYKLKIFNDDVCKDVYFELKKLLNSLGLKVNTSCAIQMSKEELLIWIDRLSVGGFCGVSQYSINIPELEMLIIPYHHMNYLIYSNSKKELLTKINTDDSSDVLIQY